jgi:fructuronate reductase/mannitol 2-dehydrogenase
MTEGNTVHPVPLNRANLARLQPPVQLPRFDPARVTAGIVHLGLGGFHRAHMARYTHNLMEMRDDALTWGIIGAGLMPADRRMRESLRPQDNLYTLVERGSAQETAAVIGSLADVVFAGDSSAALLDAIDRPEIRIVSLTVTEHGYCLNRSTKRLDPDHALIREDLAHPERPSSAIGIIVEACRRRRDAGRSPFTALSCDNIQHNGGVLRDATLALAALRDTAPGDTAPGDTALADWIAEHVSFPGTMVDRITPVTAEKDVAALADRYGIIDRWPVFAETFTQWVIEDRFPRGRPAWEDVGAQFVDHVAPYEFMKLRLLNASHLAVAGVGRLAGFVTIDQAMADPLISRYMTALMDRETGPTLPPVPGIDLSRYKATLVERFANTAIKDTVERVNTDAPLNILVDPIRDRLRMGGSIELLALALAAWLRRVRGEDEQGQPIDVRHPLAEQLRAKAIEGGTDPRPLLGMEQLFGDTGTDPRLVGPVGRWLASLYAKGSRETLAAASRQLGF